MKKILLLAGAMLALTAVVANAQLNLQYTDCGSGVVNVNDACTTNTGTNLIQASFLAPAGTQAITGEEGVLDIQTAGTAIPAWWQAVVTGSCRGTAVNVAFNTAGAACADYFNGVGSPLGGFGYDYAPVAAYMVPTPNRVRVKTVSAVDGAVASSFEAAGIAAGTDTYVFTFKFTKAKTVGTGLCAGCNVAACLVFNSLKLTQPVGVGDFMLTTGGGSGGYCTWQGGAVGAGQYGTGCPGATPTKASSWGQVKALYR